MYKDEFTELANQLVKRVDFQDGVVQEILEEEVSKGRILDVRWKGKQIIEKRQLTSYMNTTKWMEFLQVMSKEIFLRIPYAFRTLFDTGRRNDELFDDCYCRECFNGYDFKSLEWVKVKPKFCERRYRGRLIDDEEVWHDLEEEFIRGMKKYSIPYEGGDGTYIVYGYR